ncbi:50S ribosome-binding GTPase [Ceratobasidium theobromae]|uniref:50S ribosome-binding GTPase n=1 Tax=Ceratobasidium theobromae TaxID=1582974 RepID=A0A5N5QDP6_9AGAM|nr:50S ribosome-binding GTPase [Ceratobasidium theobromae]
MWHDPPEQIELDREQELKNSKEFFQPILANGARMTRYFRRTDTENTRDIIRMCISNTPRLAQLVDDLSEGALLEDTAADKTLHEELIKLIETQKTVLDIIHQKIGEDRRQSEAKLEAAKRENRNINCALATEREDRKKERKQLEEEQQRDREEIATLRAQISELQERMNESRGGDRS